MNNDPALTGAGVPLAIAGQEFQMHSLSDKDFVELDEWIRQRMMKTALASLAGITDSTLRAEIIQNATIAASTATWLSGPGVKILSTVDGVSRMLWQSVKKGNPNVTHADLRSLCFDRDNVEEIVTTFNRINKFKLQRKKGSQATEPELAPLTTETLSTKS